MMNRSASEQDKINHLQYLQSKMGFDCFENAIQSLLQGEIPPFYPDPKQQEIDIQDKKMFWKEYDRLWNEEKQKIKAKQKQDKDDEK